MKRALLCFIFLHAGRFDAQDRPLDITSSVVVRHLHSGGWASHELRLDLTSTTLLLNGSQDYSSSSGVKGYCVFPAVIPLEKIIRIQANASLAYAGFTDVYTIRLSLEYEDERGGTRSLTFIPDDAIQTYNKWSGGDQQPIRDFVIAVRYAADVRTQQLKVEADPQASKPSSSPQPIDPDTGEKLEAPSFAEQPAGPSAVGLDQGAPPGSVSYTALMPSHNMIRAVDVWPVSPVDHAKLRVEDALSKDILIDAPLEDIESVKVRQRVVKYAEPTPGEIVIPFDPAQGPKVYELCMRIRIDGSKHIAGCLISDLARCSPGLQCQEGEDQGRDIVSLEKEINDAITARVVELKRSKH